MALVYLANKPQVLGIITRWLLLFLEYNFIVMYKPGIIHIVTDALSRLPNIIEPTCVPHQTTHISLFYIKPECLIDLKEFLRISQIEGMLSI
jgi:hypothetical protein